MFLFVQMFAYCLDDFLDLFWDGFWDLLGERYWKTFSNDFFDDLGALLASRSCGPKLVKKWVSQLVQK